MEWLSRIPVFLVVLWMPSCDGQRTACWKNTTVNETDFKLCTDSIPRDNAQNACVSINMSLAVVSSSGLFNYFRQFLVNNSLNKNEIWVGANFSKTATSFVWDTGEIVVSSFLSSSTLVSSYYDGMCLRFYTDQMLKELNCSSSRGFLCQEFPQTRTFTAVSLTTDAPQATTHNAATPSTVDDLTTDLTSSSSNSATGNAATTAPPGEETSAAPTRGGGNVSSAETVTSLSAETSSATSSSEFLSTDTTMSYMGNISKSQASTPVNCMCDCFVVEVPLNKTMRDALMAEETERIRQHLLLNTETLSSYMRKKISIMDSRPSATFVGGVGIAVMVSTFLLIVLMDAPYIIQCIHGIAQTLQTTKVVSKHQGPG